MIILNLHDSIDKKMMQNSKLKLVIFLLNFVKFIFIRISQKETLINSYLFNNYKKAFRNLVSKSFTLKFKHREREMVMTIKNNCLKFEMGLFTFIKVYEKKNLYYVARI